MAGELGCTYADAPGIRDQKLGSARTATHTVTFFILSGIACLLSHGLSYAMNDVFLIHKQAPTPHANTPVPLTVVRTRTTQIEIISNAAAMTKETPHEYIRE